MHRIMHRESWAPVPEDSDFPLRNLPYGVFRRPGESPRVGVALGEHVVDLSLLEQAGLFEEILLPGSRVFARDALNGFLGMGKTTWTGVRHVLLELLDAGTSRLRDEPALRREALVPLEEVELLLPFHVGDYTDFYSSLEHATNLGKMFRPDQEPLLPNWRHLPVGYNGRAGSVVASGTPVRRPWGQVKPEGEPPRFQPSRLLDFELEVGFVTGPPNPLGTPIPIQRAHDHIFGLVLVNDWSARDIQKWEYVPLGPFLGKSFATTISPWVVPLEALEPFRVSAPRQDPPPLPHLQETEPGGYDLTLEVWLQPAESSSPTRISRTSFRTMYWTIAQQLAHQTGNGTNIRPGDLYASGTVSGSEPGTYGSLIELTWRGTKPLELPGGIHRSFLADGDTVILRGWGETGDYRIGFGECRGTVLPAQAAHLWLEGVEPEE